MINESEKIDTDADLRIQIFVLSKDRAVYLDEAIQSILNQDYTNFEVIVSDNSENDEVEKLLKNKYPQVKFVRRIPAVPALEHFRLVISECSRELAVLFHDDDVLMPGYLTSMIDALDRHPNVSAVGCNALILRDQILTNNRFMRSFSHPVILETPESLLEPYLGLEMFGPAPFPGYLYRTSVIKGLFLDSSEGGKYSDVSFLLKLLRRGTIYWTPDLLMQYRVHSGNDSNEASIGQKLRLLRYIYRTTTLNMNSRVISEYRFDYWRRWLANNKSAKLHSRKYRIVLTFVVFKAITCLLTRPGLWLRLKNLTMKRYGF